MPTVFDDLYTSLFGGKCTKEGQAFERIAAAVAKLISPDSDVAHDEKLRGQISQTLYQVDVLETTASQSAFGEAKDYTVQGKKVGRGDLQKLGGALPDVGVQKGVFYSATDYTAPAKKYAQAAGSFGKPIDLVHIRPSTEKDEQGRIKRITINLNFFTPNYDKAVFSPVWAPSAQKTLAAWVDSQGGAPIEVSTRLENFLDSEGNLKTTIRELTSRGFEGGWEVAKGSFLLPNHYIKVEHLLLELTELKYEVPFHHALQVVEIVATGTPQIIVKKEDGTFDKLIRDEELKRISFDESGNVTFQ